MHRNGDVGRNTSSFFGFAKRWIATLCLFGVVVFAAPKNTFAFQPNPAFSAYIDWPRAEVQVRISNRDLSPITIVLGGIIGNQLASNIEYSIDAPKGASGEKLINRDEPSVIGGNAETAVVCIVPNAEYTLRVSMRKLFVPSQGKSLFEKRGEHWKLLVKLSGTQTTGQLVQPEDRPEVKQPLRPPLSALHYWTGSVQAFVDNNNQK